MNIDILEKLEEYLRKNIEEDKEHIGEFVTNLYDGRLDMAYDILNWIEENKEA